MFKDNNSVNKLTSDYNKFYDQYSRALDLKGPFAFRTVFKFSIVDTTIYVHNYSSKPIYVPFKFKSLDIKLIPHSK